MDHVKAFGTLLTDLSTVFDCLPHSLFIAKLKAYDFNDNSLKLVNDYLSHRFQRTKIGSEHSSWKEIILDVPQCSRPLFLTSTYVIFCSLLKKSILPAFRMAMHHMSQETIFLPLFNFWRK